jgi:transglutaminase-like putative cysteine protease
MKQEKYLRSTFYMDYDNPKVQEFVEKHISNKNNEFENAISLYYAIRDGFKYNPYKLDFTPDGMKASSLLTRDHGYCIEKANLLATTARYVKIPSRLGFANVKNHIGVTRLVKVFKTEILAYHGYTELYLDGKWVKATPAFNKQLCKVFKVDPLDFTGKEDSIFQEYNRDGNKYMEYITDHGQFDDLPRERILKGLEEHYPHMFSYDALEKVGVEVKI